MSWYWYKYHQLFMCRKLWRRTLPKWSVYKLKSYYNSSSVCLFVCLSVCSLSPPRSFDGSSPNLVGVCRWTSELPLRGSFSKRSTARRVNGSLSLSTILYNYAPASCQTLQRVLLLAAAESNSAPFARRVLHCISTVYIGGPWGVLFLKGQRVDGSTGQTGRRLTSRRCM